MIKEPNIKTILREITTAAVLGGRELAKRHQTRNQLRVHVKTVASDFFTAADKASERKIIEHLQSRLPGIVISSEETPNAVQTITGKLVAEIDPLDGSMAYKHGQPYYAVSIGIRRNNTMIAGAVYLPALNELFYASRGKGSYRINTNGKKPRNPTPLKVRRDKLQNAFVGTDFNYAPETRRVEHREIHGPLLLEARYAPVLGSSTYGLAQVAKGNFSAYVHRRLDTQGSAAGILIAREAGAKVTDFNGKPVKLTEKASSLIVAHPQLHREISKLLRRRK